ncbi:hypothetical protein CFP56_036850 [Quercus suber]|uniref:Uncharacterized protein n=1 Tax=Quercus suber TaxID=58331 RepID=A0AAW0LN68_QUESU
MEYHQDSKKMALDRVKRKNWIHMPSYMDWMKSSIRKRFEESASRELKKEMGFDIAQSYIVTHWNDHGRPALDLLIQKSKENKGQVEKWAEPYIETMMTVQKMADPYIQGARKFTQPYFNQVMTVTEPYLDKVSVAS